MQGSPQPTADDLRSIAEWGLSPECLEQPNRNPIDLWPENQIPVALFEAMLSQWRMGGGGPIGLDYAALPTVARMLRIGRRDLREAFDAVRAMEGEALRVFAQQARR